MLSKYNLETNGVVYGPCLEFLIRIILESLQISRATVK